MDEKTRKLLQQSFSPDGYRDSFNDWMDDPVLKYAFEPAAVQYNKTMSPGHRGSYWPSTHMIDINPAAKQYGTGTRKQNEESSMKHEFYHKGMWELDGMLDDGPVSFPSAPYMEQNEASAEYMTVRDNPGDELALREFTQSFNKKKDEPYYDLNHLDVSREKYMGMAEENNELDARHYMNSTGAWAGSMKSEDSYMGRQDLPLNLRNNNPGNIDKSADKWQGLTEKQQKGRFATFDTLQHGVRAMAKTLYTYNSKHDKNTIVDIINRWAPEVENDTQSYINTVAKLSGIDPNTPLYLSNNPDKAFEIMKAMITVEGGRKNMKYIPDHIIKEGIRMSR